MTAPAHHCRANAAHRAGAVQDHRARCGPLLARPPGLSGDQVELVAFDVGEGRPAVLIALQVAEPLRVQAKQPLGLRSGSLAAERGGQVVAWIACRTTLVTTPGSEIMDKCGALTSVM